MKNCEYFEELISCLIDGEITDDEKLELEKHLDECTSCRELYNTYSALFGRAELVDPPEELLSGVMEAVRDLPAGKKPDSGKRMYLFVRYIAAAACLALAVFSVPRLLPGSDSLNHMKAADQAESIDSAYIADENSLSAGAEGAAAVSDSDETSVENREEPDIAPTESFHSSAGPYAAEYKAADGIPVIWIYGSLPEYVSADGAETLEDGAVLITADPDTVDRLLDDGYVIEYPSDDAVDASGDTVIIFVP